MTANLQVFQKFRDIQVAEDVGKKAELGWFDVEFTMYGCAYLNISEDKMYYKISSRAEDIYQFIEDGEREDIFPGLVEHLTFKCPVPMGTKELIAKDVKKSLAKQLSTRYTKDFFKKLYQLADEIQSNYAAMELWQQAEEIEGIFDEEKLTRFEDLVNYCYSCRKLTKEEYRRLLDWINEERKNMDDSLVSKDIFEKVMYGVAYEENGKIKYNTNAQKDYIYRVAYEREQAGLMVGPIYLRTYWYNYKYRLPDVINDFKEELKTVCDGEYIERIKILRGSVSDEMKAHYQEELALIKDQFGENAYYAALRYFNHWGVL